MFLAVSKARAGLISHCCEQRTIYVSYSSEFIKELNEILDVVPIAFVTPTMTPPTSDTQSSASAPLLGTPPGPDDLDMNRETEWIDLDEE